MDTVDRGGEDDLIDSDARYPRWGDSGFGQISEGYAPRSSAFSSLVFAVLMGAVCLWILSLPLFPSQDGPMHRYYVHVLDNLFRHNGLYSGYEIRHPLPPYATHYAVLLLLSQAFSYDTAEKLLVCLIVLSVGYGLRFSARQIGAAGEWTTLLCTPLLLVWSLMGGMFNFVLGVGLALLATGFWQRVPKYGLRSLTAFTAVLLVLTYTHPVPLLLLIVVCTLDLALSFPFYSRSRGFTTQWLREHRWQLTGFLFMLAAAIVPLLDTDGSQTHTALSQVGLHLRLLGAHVLLYGISPYNSRSRSLWINAYRLCLYAIYVGCMWAGGRATIEVFRRKQTNFGVTCFFAALLLTIALPFLPNDVNGSTHFADRLVFVLWPVAILAASAAPLPSFRRQLTIAGAGFVCCVCTLMAAHFYLRPLAYELHKIELEPLPHDAYGTIMPGYMEGQYVRYHDQIVFNPFKWAPLLAFLGQNDVLLNSPWVGQKILPLEAAPHSPVFNMERDATAPSNTDMESVAGAALPAWQEARVVRNSSFIFYVATSSQLAQGLSERLLTDDAAQYQCGPSRSWYVVCVKKEESVSLPRAAVVSP
jgi:hypothetical protein